MTLDEAKEVKRLHNSGHKLRFHSICKILNNEVSKYSTLK